MPQSITTTMSAYNVQMNALPPYLVVAATSVLISIVFLAYRFATLERPTKLYPVIGLEEEGLNPKESFFDNADKVIAKGLQTGGPFQVITGTGPKLSYHHARLQIRLRTNTTGIRFCCQIDTQKKCAMMTD
jgi:hypothetical protein